MRHTDQRSNVLSTRVPEPVRASLEQLAQRRQVPLSVVVREALEAFSAAHPAGGVRPMPRKRRHLKAEAKRRLRGERS